MAAAVYLASPAAAMSAGTHLIVDGGWTTPEMAPQIEAIASAARVISGPR